MEILRFHYFAGLVERSAAQCWLHMRQFFVRVDFEWFGCIFHGEVLLVFGICVQRFESDEDGSVHFAKRPVAGNDLQQMDKEFARTLNNRFVCL